MKNREKQRVQGQRELDMLTRLTTVSEVDICRIERDLRARVKDWRSLLRRQTPVSRQIITKLLTGRLVFMPRPEEDRYEFSGEAQLGKLMQGVVLPQVWRPQRDRTACKRPSIAGFRQISRAARRSRRLFTLTTSTMGRSFQGVTPTL